MTKFQNSDFDAMKVWLISAFANIEPVKSVYLIGSVLYKNQKETNDIDVVQQIQFEMNSTIAQNTIKISSIRDEFAKQFAKPLHITTFTQNELEAFEEFMSKNTYIKLL